MDSDIGQLQQNLNQLTKPKNVIEMLKDKQETNNKRRVIQMQDENIQLTQILNKRIFECKNIQDKLKTLRQEYSLLNVQQKKKDQNVKIVQIEALEAKLLITHENLNLA